MKRVVMHGAIVLLAVALATALTEASFSLGAELTFEWYVAAVACVAWWCGRAPALAAAVIASAVVDFAFLPMHRFSFGMGLTDSARLLIFVGLGLLVAHLVSARRLAEEERTRRERLLATVAHELGNMIFALRTWTVALQSERLPSERFDHAVRALAQTADAITKLAGDLVDWARITLGRLDMQLENLDLAEVVQDAIQEMRGEATELGINLSWSLAPTRVRADRTRLHQVALNLLTNSLRATRPGGEIVVSVCSADRRALFSVRDTGRGIAPQMLDRLFEQGALHGESKGLGLGLTLSRDLIRAHGGDVTVHSRGLGTGATFAVDLPVADRAARPTVEGRAA
jgi:signal transduction histidine kinase